MKVDLADVLMVLAQMDVDNGMYAEHKWEGLYASQYLANKFSKGLSKDEELENIWKDTVVPFAH